jgi:hypothetical protein
MVKLTDEERIVETVRFSLLLKLASFYYCCAG